MKIIQPVTKKIGYLYHLLCRAEIFVCEMFFLLIVTLVFISALLRKLGIPIQWSNDVSQLLFAWAAFLGGDIALREGALVGVGLITQKLSDRTQKFLSLLCYGLMLVLLYLFVAYGFPLTFRNWPRAFQSLPLSYGWVTLSLPVSAILMIFSILRNVIRIFQQITEHSKSGEIVCGY